MLDIVVVLAIVGLIAGGGHLDDFGRDAVEQVTVVRNHDDGSIEFLQRVLQHLLASDIQVVGWFVQNQHVAALQHHDRKGHLCALTAGQAAHQFVDVVAGEQYPPQNVAHLHLVHIGEAIPNLVDGCLVRVQLAVFLLIVGNFYLLSPLKVPCFQRNHLLDGLEQGGFSDTVLADDGDLLPSHHIQLHVPAEDLAVFSLPDSDAHAFPVEDILDRRFVVGKAEGGFFLPNHRLLDAVHPLQRSDAGLGALGGRGAGDIFGHVLLHRFNLLLLLLIFLELPLHPLLFLHHIGGIVPAVGGEHRPLQLPDVVDQTV